MRILNVLSFMFVLMGMSSAFAEPEFIVAFGSSVTNLMNKVKPEFEKATGTKLGYVKSDGMGADAALMALDAGRADIAVVGSSMDEAMGVIKSKSISLKSAAKFQTKEVHQDKIYFVVFEGGPKALTKDQFKNIMTGAVANWKEVGSVDAPVQLTLQVNTPASQKMISMRLLDGADMNRKGIKMFKTYEEQFKFVATTKGAIGFGPGSIPLSGSVRLTEPELSRPFTAVTIGAPNEKAEKLMELLLASK